MLYSDKSQNKTAHRTQIDVASASGSIYLASCLPELLHQRKFLVAAGRLLPTWEKSSELKLSRVQNWIMSAPEEDSLVILDIIGPNVAQRKWMYATKEPYIEIEPAWMFLLSFGVLSARQQHLQIRVASAEWPFADSSAVT